MFALPCYLIVDTSVLQIATSPSLVCAGINDLFTVCSELVGVAHKWKKVGLALRLDPDLLDRIEAEKNKAVENLSDMLKEWLKKSYDTESFGDPSWKLLVDAVAHPVGGEDRALAMEIAAKYNGKFYQLIVCVVLTSTNTSCFLSLFHSATSTIAEPTSLTSILNIALSSHIIVGWLSEPTHFPYYVISNTVTLENVHAA